MKQQARNLVFVVTMLGLISAMQAEVQAEGITEEQAVAILSELRQIRLLLEKQQATSLSSAAIPPAPEKVKVSVDGHYALGAQDAPLTLVEFTDYQCPFCNKFHLTTFAELKKRYIDTGKVRFVSWDLPLEVHAYAFQAARATRCAGEQNKYWELRDKFSANPNNLGHEGVLQSAREVALEMSQFQACLESDRYQAEVRKDVAEALAIGMRGTPGFVLGKSAHDNFEGIRIVGAQPYAAFEVRIEALLAHDSKP